MSPTKSSKDRNTVQTSTSGGQVETVTVTIVALKKSCDVLLVFARGDRLASSAAGRRQGVNGPPPTAPASHLVSGDTSVKHEL